MNWRTLLARLQPAPDPIPALVRASADRAGQVNRRAFLQLAGATVAAAMAIDPEQLLWSPRPSLLVPDATLVTARTLDEAVQKGLTILWLDGTRQDIAGTLAGYGGFEGLTRYVRAHGGTLVGQKPWIDHLERTQGGPTRFIEDQPAFAVAGKKWRL